MVADAPEHRPLRVCNVPIPDKKEEEVRVAGGVCHAVDGRCRRDVAAVEREGRVVGEAWQAWNEELGRTHACARGRSARRHALGPPGVRTFVTAWRLSRVRRECSSSRPHELLHRGQLIALRMGSPHPVARVEVVVRSRELSCGRDSWRRALGPASVSFGRFISDEQHDSRHHTRPVPPTTSTIAQSVRQRCGHAEAFCFVSGVALHRL